MSTTASGAIKTAAAGAVIGLASSIITNSSTKTAVLSAAMLALALAIAWCIIARLVKGQSFKSIKSTGADMLHAGILLAIAGLAIYLNNPKPQLVYLAEGEGFKTAKDYLVADSLITDKDGHLVELRGYDSKKQPVLIGLNRPHKIGSRLVYLWTHETERIVLDINGEKKALYPGQQLVAGNSTIKIDNGKIYLDDKSYAIFTGKISEDIKITAYQKGLYAGLLLKYTRGYIPVFFAIALSLAGLALLAISKFKKEKT